MLQTHSFLAFIAVAALAALAISCCPTPEKQKPEAPAHTVNLYARLHETQFKDTAEQQYLPNIRETFSNYQATFEIEEIRGTEDTVEFIGIDVVIEAPDSETEKLETFLMDTLRLSGAPYATQIFIINQQ